MHPVLSMAANGPTPGSDDRLQQLLFWARMLSDEIRSSEYWPTCCAVEAFSLCIKEMAPMTRKHTL